MWQVIVDISWFLDLPAVCRRLAHDDISELFVGSIFSEVTCNYNWPLKMEPTKSSEMSSAILSHTPWRNPETKYIIWITVKTWRQVIVVFNSYSKNHCHLDNLSVMLISGICEFLHGVWYCAFTESLLFCQFTSRCAWLPIHTESESWQLPTWYD
jgi:hypothetical protein